MRESLVLELELQPDPAGLPLRHAEWSTPDSTVRVRLLSQEAGHGFGLSEVVTVLVSVAAGAASNLVADAIRGSVGTVIKRVRARSGRADGSAASLTALVEAERRLPPQDPDA